MSNPGGPPPQILRQGRRTGFDGETMFQVNDYVVYSNLGICQIKDLRPARLGGAEPLCYVLKCLADPASTLFVPTDGADLEARLRPARTRAEVLALIQGMPAEPAVDIQDERERGRDLMARVHSGDCRQLIRVIKTLHQEQARKRARGKTLTTTDARILAQAERLLAEEFAFALGITPEAVVPFILEHLPRDGGDPAPAVNG